MTHKELIPKLIEHYQFGIDNLPMEDWDGFLDRNYLCSGICWCSSFKFDLDIGNSKWIKQISNNQNYICPTPYYEPREKALEYLQIRLNALKSIDLNTIEL